MAKAKRLIDEAVEASRIVSSDVEVARLRSQLSALKSQYKAALLAITAERQRGDAMAAFDGIKAFKAPARKPSRGKNEATAVVLLSDWHCEERVPAETVLDKNYFDLDVADRRIAELSDRFEMLIHHERRLAKINKIVIAALGDFISNIIHDDTAELAQLAPQDATLFAGQRLRSIIDRAARLADEVVVVTSVGNHGRTTMKPRIATESSHSFEQMLYRMMASQERNRNVSWQIGEGYLNVIDLDGYKIAFHHGHGIRGNVHSGATKAIAQWQKTYPVDFHCFGHHHQFAYCRGKYLSNGSLIGYNGYALRFGLLAEAPCQSLAVVCHERREITRAIPIFCDRDLQEAMKCQQSTEDTSSVSSKRTASFANKSKKDCR